MNFDYNFNHLQKRAEVTFEAKRYVKKEHKCDFKKSETLILLTCYEVLNLLFLHSDSNEERPADNKVDISIPVLYDAGIVLSR